MDIQSNTEDIAELYSGKFLLLEKIKREYIILVSMNTQISLIKYNNEEAGM